MNRQKSCLGIGNLNTMLFEFPMPNSVYEEISEEFGFDVAIKMYQIYKVMQISFPTRLFNPEYVKKQIPIEYDGTNVKQLAKKYGYSEKTVRRMIKDL